MAKKTHVAVVIVNFGGFDDTKECLASLKEIHNPSFEFNCVVVNEKDSSEKKTSEEGKKLQTLFPFITVLESENIGFSGANNLGIAYALKEWESSYVLLLNNDTRVHPDFLQNLVMAAEKHGDMSLYSPKIYFEEHMEYHKEAYSNQEHGKILWYAGGLFDWENIYGWHRGVDEVDHGQFDVEEKTQFSTGCCMLIPRNVIKQIGLLHTDYFLYLEDVDYSVRLEKKGGSCWYIPSSLVWHKNAGSSGGSGSQLHQYYQTRNRLLFGLKYASVKTKLALFREAAGMMMHGTPIQKEAIRDFMMRAYGKRGAV